MPEDSYTPRVLVALVSEEDREFLSELLSRRGMAVVQARDAKEALEVIEEEGVDLMFLERELPADTASAASEGSGSLRSATAGPGLSLLESLRREDALRFLPVIYVLPSFDESVIDELVRAGADEYLLRPLTEDKVMLRVRVLLRVGAERRALLDTLAHAREAAHTEGELAERARIFVQEVLGSISTLILVIDGEHRLRFINRKAREILGVGEETVLPAVRDVLGEEFYEQPGVAGGLSVAVETGESVRLEGLTITGSDGRSLIVDMQTGPVHTEEERLTVISLEDVTQRWEAEQELLLEKMKLEDTVNTMGAAVCLVDREQKVVWHNRTFVSWFGPPGDKTCWQLLKHRPRPCDNCIMEKVFSDGVSGYEEWRLVGPQGQIQAYQNHVTPIRGPGGRVVSALVLTQEITQQVMRIEQLRLLRQLGSALEANLEKNRLLYMVLSMVTAGHALGFNRAFIFLVDEDERTLRGAMALGPTSREEAFRIWAELSSRQESLQDFLQAVDRAVQPEEIPISHLILNLQYDMYRSEELIARVARTGEAMLVEDATNHPEVSKEFRGRFQSEQFALIPMMAKGRCTGVLMADNHYNRRPMTRADMDLLQMFAQQAALAISNAATFERLRDTIAELNSTRQQLVQNERLASIGKTAAFVAHEIRNPLVTMGGFARSLKKRPGDRARVDEGTGIIIQEIERLEGMLKGVMDFARPSTPVFTTEDLNSLVTASLGHTTAIVANSRIEMEHELSPGLPPVRMDIQQMEQVLLNLVKNSTEAFGDGPGHILIKTWADDNRSHVYLSVDDNAGGIPQEILDRIFDPFYTTKRYGSGLGLAICRGIVAGHDGILEVLNRPGQGVEMRIRLPAATATPLEPGLEALGDANGAASEKRRR